MQRQNKKKFYECTAIIQIARDSITDVFSLQLHFFIAIESRDCILNEKQESAEFSVCMSSWSVRTAWYQLIYGISVVHSICSLWLKALTLFCTRVLFISGYHISKTNKLK